MLLRFLAACRQARWPGGRARTSITLDGARLDQYAAATINHRLIAISGMFAFRGHARPGRAEPGAEGTGGPPGTGRGAQRAAGACGPPPEGPGRRCGCASRGGCRGRWTSRRPLSCWPASGPGGTGRSPG